MTHPSPEKRVKFDAIRRPSDRNLLWIDGLVYGVKPSTAERHSSCRDNLQEFKDFDDELCGEGIEGGLWQDAIWKSLVSVEDLD